MKRPEEQTTEGADNSALSCLSDEDYRDQLVGPIGTSVDAVRSDEDFISRAERLLERDQELLTRLAE